MNGLTPPVLSQRRQEFEISIRREDEIYDFIDKCRQENGQCICNVYCNIDVIDLYYICRNELLYVVAFMY